MAKERDLITNTTPLSVPLFITRLCLMNRNILDKDDVPISISIFICPI